jgi:hypothetical protein
VTNYFAWPRVAVIEFVGSFWDILPYKGLLEIFCKPCGRVVSSKLTLRRGYAMLQSATFCSK